MNVPSKRSSDNHPNFSPFDDAWGNYRECYRKFFNPCFRPVIWIIDGIAANCIDRDTFAQSHFVGLGRRKSGAVRCSIAGPV